MVNSNQTNFILFLVVCLLTCFAQAQSPASGSIRGVVYDKEFDTPIRGVAVMVFGLKSRATTNENGSYVLPNLPVGPYTLVITKEGYVREVKANVQVKSGELIDTDVYMAGEFEDMDEFVVQDVELGGEVKEEQQMVEPVDLEAITFIPTLELQLRLESPQLLDSVGVEMISRSGAADAAAVLLLVPGASLQDGKYAVIRGLPDRYVSTLLDGVRLPSADPNKRAVKLDQFPSAVIESIQVSKTFTPDQQGDASGGAVNIVLRDIPDEGFLQFKSQVGFNSQVKNGSFLTYPGGSLGLFGENDVLSSHPELEGQSWPNNPTGTTNGDAPLIYKWSVAGGNTWEFDEGTKFGAFGNFFYDQDASYFDNGVLNSLEQNGVGTPLVPEQFGTGENFKTQLFDVTQGTQSVQWGGMGILGLETENNKLAAKFLYTQLSENQAVLLVDTRGKDYYFPGYNPNDLTGIGHDQPEAAPYNRLETLDYSQLGTQSIILSGEHSLAFLGFGDGEEGSGDVFGTPVFDWRFSLSQATENQPDQTQFAAYWVPPFEVVPGLVLPEQWIQYPPAQSAFVGWVQHINYYNEENSTQGATNLKLPFTQWNDREGYVKAGAFADSVSRSYTQDTFSNNGDPNSSYSSGFNQPWSAVFPSQDHPIYQSTTDISYDGAQNIMAYYGMVDMPINETMSIVTGVRYETTEMTTTVLPDENANWINVQTQTVQNFDGPNEWDANFTDDRILPMIGWNWDIQDDLVLRTAFAQTLARPNFFELVPVIQYEYIGAPIFIGNPDLQMSSLDNYDIRLDWTPHEKWLISGSLFYKDIQDPIQYVQRFTEGFSYTSPLNFPEGQLFGAEFEARITLDPLFGEEFAGLGLGTNLTVMSSQVTLSDSDAQALATYGVNETTQPMTATPDFIWNINATYQYEPWGTQIGIFYNLQGQSLISAANPYTTLLTPAIYQLSYGTLNFTCSQEIIEGLRFSLAAKNILNPEIQTQYQTSEGITGLQSSYTAGIDFSIGLTYQITF